MFISDWNAYFLKPFLANSVLDTLNLVNILHHKSVKHKIPPDFKDKSDLIICHSYTTPIETKIFNYKHVVHDLNIDGSESKPPDITGDLNIINNTSLRNTVG